MNTTKNEQASQGDDWLLSEEPVVLGMSRRRFLLSSASLTFGVAFGGSLAGLGKAFAADTSSAGAITPSAWMQVAADGIVTIMAPASEMGQGVMTALPLLIAEDMDLDWSKVRVQQSPVNPKLYGNPGFGGAMSTGASRTTQGYYYLLRTAGKQARQVMMMAAAEKWGVPVAELDTEPHVVVHKASGRRLGYGEIAAFAKLPAQLPEISKEELKPMSEFRLIGSDIPRVDVPDKTTGTASYGIDTQLPGMVYGSIVRTPVQGEKPVKVDDSAALKVPGVLKIVTLPYGVGVIAETYWAAYKARKQLKIEWSTDSQARSYDSDQVMSDYANIAKDLKITGVDFLKEGDAVGALSRAGRTITADYASAHIAHTTMEPMNATAWVTGDKIELWAPTQAPTGATVMLARGLGFKPENITLHVTFLGGGFGRRVDNDYVADAAGMAKAMPGRPVKTVWSREDDVHYDKYRPLAAQHLIAGVDENGKLLALRHRIVGETVYGRVLPPVFKKLGGKDPVVCDGSQVNYEVPDRLVEYMREARGRDVGFWRGVGPGYTKFAVESFIDEIAAAYEKDPIEYRLAMLDKHPRARAVMQEVSKMADWKRERPGRALGFAYSDFWNTHCAEIAEVSVDPKTGAIKVHEVWAAVDPGVALQPRNIEAQIEGAVIFGISSTLSEEITIKAGQTQQSNFHDYKVLRMSETPKVTVKVMSTDNKPGGMGEVGLPPISAAIGNAVFKLTGKRLRRLPLDHAQLKA